MSISKKEDIIQWGIEYDSARDGALSGFFTRGSANRIRGSRANEICLP